MARGEDLLARAAAGVGRAVLGPFSGVAVPGVSSQLRDESCLSWWQFPFPSETSRGGWRLLEAVGIQGGQPVLVLPQAGFARSGRLWGRAVLLAGSGRREAAQALQGILGCVSGPGTGWSLTEGPGG